LPETTFAPLMSDHKTAILERPFLLLLAIGLGGLAMIRRRRS